MTLTEIVDRPLRTAAQWVNEPGTPWRAIFFCLAWLLLLNASPENLLRPDRSGAGDAPSYSRKLREPFADLAKSSSDYSHGAKLNYRIAVPLLARALHLDLHGLRLAGPVLALLFVPLLLRLFEEVLGDRTAAFFWTLAILATPVSGRLFNDLHPFDRFGILVGILAAVSRQPLVVFLSVLFVSWSDERLHLACVWVLALGFLRLAQVPPFSAERRRCVGGVSSALLGCVAYWLTRWWAYKSTGMTVASGGISPRMLIVHHANLPVGAFLSLESAWYVLVACLAGMALRKGERIYAVCLAGIVLLGVVASACVIDFTRSLNFFWMALPVVVGFARWRMPALWTVETLRVTGIALALTCVLLPSTELYLVGFPQSRDGLGGRYCLLDRYKPLPMRVAAWCVGMHRE